MASLSRPNVSAICKLCCFIKGKGGFVWIVLKERVPLELMNQSANPSIHPVNMACQTCRFDSLQGQWHTGWVKLLRSFDWEGRSFCACPHIFCSFKHLYSCPSQSNEDDLGYFNFLKQNTLAKHLDICSEYPNSNSFVETAIWLRSNKEHF